MRGLCTDCGRDCDVRHYSLDEWLCYPCYRLRQSWGNR